jgi:hypothetical protein
LLFPTLPLAKMFRNRLIVYFRVEAPGFSPVKKLAKCPTGL